MSNPKIVFPSGKKNLYAAGGRLRSKNCEGMDSERKDSEGAGGGQLCDCINGICHFEGYAG